MSAELHPLAPHTLPSFIGAADGSDPLFSAITVIPTTISSGWSH